jgi:hypothetical protein
MRRTTLTLAATLAAALGPASVAQAGEPVTVRFTEPGGRMFTVPSGVTSVRAVAIGGRGGQGGVGFGGFGARVTADLAVAPGQALWIEVGGAGGVGGISTTMPVPSPGGAAGAGGGGRGGSGGVVDASNFLVLGGGGGGGGASIVHACEVGQDPTICSVVPGPIIVAAGGGGGAADKRGGDGGTPLGAAGEGGGAGGGGGTLDAGGSSRARHGAGRMFQGGSATDVGEDVLWYAHSGGGGGGGGYYGGGAGAQALGTSATAGGGGSSYGPQGASYAVDDSEPASVTLTFADTVAPRIDIAAPVDGATYVGGEPVMAGFACDDDGSGVATCSGTVGNGEALDMSPGEHAFTVTATDRSGNRREVTTRYTILGEPVSPGSPALPTDDEADRGPVDPPSGDAVVDQPTVKVRSVNCGRRTCRVSLTLGGDVRRFRAELATGRRQVVKAGAARPGAKRVILRRPAGDADAYALTVTATASDGATATVRRTVRP